MLYPMGVGQLIDASIKIYRRNWKTFAAIVAWLLVPFAALQAFATRNVSTSIHFPSTSNPQSPANSFGSVFPGNTLLLLFGFYVVLYLLVYPFLNAAIARGTADLYLGHEITVKKVYTAALKRFPSLLWVLLLDGTIVLVGAVLLIVPGVFFLVRLILAPVVVVLEN
ncbi:MAG TPA: hypothetical protein VKY26_12405, partial [Actinomycetota bacterium]|nr:hypothetical protein [Actinomycetota bacterium]